MGVEITDAMVAAACVELGRHAEIEGHARTVRSALSAALAAAPSPVGVTSSDERADCKGKGHDVGDPAAPCVSCHGDLTREQLAVPSSDEPEGDDAEVHSIAQWLVFNEYGDWRYDPGNTEWDDYSERAARLAEHLRAFRATRPVPVGDAEPVQWGLEDENGEIVGTARLRDDAESLAAELLGGLDLKVVPLFRLPVSSQDAGALAEVDAILAEYGAANVNPFGPEPSRAERLRYAIEHYCGPPGAPTPGLVERVLPAEGEKRDELIARMGFAMADPDVLHDLTAKATVAYDALRAAAGKAGSDDAA